MGHQIGGFYQVCNHMFIISEGGGGEGASTDPHMGDKGAILGWVLGVWGRVSFD
jgi:hypothetical protein